MRCSRWSISVCSWSNVGSGIIGWFCFRVRGQLGTGRGSFLNDFGLDSGHGRTSGAPCTGRILASAKGETNGGYFSGRVANGTKGVFSVWGGLCLRRTRYVCRYTSLSILWRYGRGASTIICSIYALICENYGLRKSGVMS